MSVLKLPPLNQLTKLLLGLCFTVGSLTCAALSHYWYVRCSLTLLVCSLSRAVSVVSALTLSLVRSLKTAVQLIRNVNRLWKSFRLCCAALSHSLSRILIENNCNQQKQSQGRRTETSCHSKRNGVAGVGIKMTQLDSASGAARASLNCYPMLFLPPITLYFGCHIRRKLVACLADDDASIL